MIFTAFQLVTPHDHSPTKELYKISNCNQIYDTLTLHYNQSYQHSLEIAIIPLID